MDLNRRIHRRRLLKLVGTSLAGAGLLASINPLIHQLGSRYLTADGNPELDALKKPVDPTPSSQMQKPNIPQEEINFMASHEVSLADTSRSVVAVTYDDLTADNQLTDLLNVYMDHGVKTTFFAMGADLIHCKVNIPRLVEEGHDLAFHGWVHDMPFTQLSDEAIHTQFRMFAYQINSLLPGYRVRWFRAPFGSRNQRVRDIAAQWGMQSVMWSLESGGNDRTTFSNVVDRVKPGDIVLSHVNRVYDISEADTILRTLIRKGYSIESLTTAIPASMKYNQI